MELPEGELEQGFDDMMCRIGRVFANEIGYRMHDKGMNTYFATLSQNKVKHAAMEAIEIVKMSSRKI